LDKDPDYRTLAAVFVTTPPKWPNIVGAAAFKELADQLVELDFKSKVTNPQVTVVLDFWTSVKALPGASEAAWSKTLNMVAARSRLRAESELWSDTVVGVFDPKTVDAACLNKLLKLASKLCAGLSDSPLWHDELKARQQTDAAAAEAAAKLAAGTEAAPAAGTKTDVDTHAAPAAGTKAAPAPAAVATAAPAAGAKAAPAAGANAAPAAEATKDEPRPWMVGDIVLVKSKITKYDGYEAQVVKAPVGDHAKLELKMMGGIDIGKKWKCQKAAANQLVMPSVDDPDHAAWKKRKHNALFNALGASGASAGSSASAGSGAGAGSGERAGPATAVLPLDTDAVAKHLFGDGSAERCESADAEEVEADAELADGKEA